MSDEYQPNEVVDPEAEETRPEPKQEPAPVAAPAPVDASASESAEPAVEKPSVVSLADLDATSGSDTKGPGFMANLAGFLRSYGWIVGILAVVALVALLFLPPISLASRLGSGGFTLLSADNPSVSHPDGITITRTGEGTSKLRVKLGSVPRADFTSDKVDEELVPAVSSIPVGLEAKSPYYTIETKSNNGTAAQISVVIPNGSEPWETLGLYAWDGSQWAWIPSTLDTTQDPPALIANSDALPSSVMAMQTTSTGRYVSAFVEQWPAGGVVADLHEIDVAGLLVGTVGGVNGDTGLLPLADAGGTASVLPVVRNWIPGREYNWDLVHDMLTENGNRPLHVDNLTKIALDGGYPGLVVDYRGAPASDRDVYTAFVTELAAKFHENGLKLAVVVDTPAPSVPTWDTSGYDWMALGAAADELRMVMPSNPEAYRAGGTVDTMISWALSQVERRKLMPMFTTLSTDGENFVKLEDVYSAVGRVSATANLPESIEPGTNLAFSLSPSVMVTMDPELGATGVAVNDKVYWLGTGQWLRTRMDIAVRYRLGGVVLWTLYDEGNDASVLAAVSGFIADAMAVPDAAPEVAWQITDPTGKVSELSSQLTQPQLSWTAPDITGTYTIQATVAGLDKGSMTVSVMPPAQVLTETLTEEGEDTEGATSDVLEGDALKASYVADVTVPDNTRFEKGEEFTKTWRMKNSGTEDWPATTVMIFASDTSLSETTEVKVGAVKVGEEVDISVDMVAPDEDGTYKSTWKLNTGKQDIPGGATYVQIVVGEQAAAPPPTVSAPVQSGSFELGGHIRDQGYPYANQMHYAGMTWAKDQIRWGQDGAARIQAAHANGFKIQLSALGDASMVTQPGFTEQYAAWVAGMAAAGADAIEIWNEPNIDREWAAGHISPQTYTNFLCKAYSAIKAANPGTAVISAAPAPTGWFGGCGPNGCDDQPWLEGLYNAGAANCMDYIGAHHNAGATSPSARSGHPADNGGGHHSWYFLPQTELYYNIFRGTRQIFYTEMGYASQEGVPAFSEQFWWAGGNDNSEQAAWLAEGVQLSINTGMVKCIVVWNIDFGRYGYDPQDGFAIIRPGGGCPACESLHNLLGTR